MAPLGADVLRIDASAVADRIQGWIVRVVSRALHRRGVVIGVSGGVDSAVCLGLACRALGVERVLPLLMPEADSPRAATERAVGWCARLGVRHVVEPVEEALRALGCYRRRDAAITSVFPDYGPGYRQKLAFAEGMLDRDAVPYFNLIVRSPAGKEEVTRLPAPAYRDITAATNMKQRARKLVEYFHAERMNYAVLGTANRLEHELGFFVRGGDGLADLKPIAHLYKTQVISLAEYLGVPDEIVALSPTTDTFSLPQTQEEFYFGLPLADLDLLLHAHTQGIAPTDVWELVGLRPEQVERAYRDIESKRRTAARTSMDALLVEPVPLPSIGR